MLNFGLKDCIGVILSLSVSQCRRLRVQERRTVMVFVGDGMMCRNTNQLFLWTLLSRPSEHSSVVLSAGFTYRNNTRASERAFSERCYLTSKGLYGSGKRPPTNTTTTTTTATVRRVGAAAAAAAAAGQMMSVCVCSFFSCRLVLDPFTPTRSLAHIAIGPAYMPPEPLQEPSFLDGKTDVVDLAR